MVFQSDTQAVMERFPVQLIREPTAFTSRDPMEMYNNILVFIVGGSGSRSEMHIFQASALQAKVINFVWPVLKVLTQVQNRHTFVEIFELHFFLKLFLYYICSGYVNFIFMFT